MAAATARHPPATARPPARRRRHPRPVAAAAAAPASSTASDTVLTALALARRAADPAALAALAALAATPPAPPPPLRIGRKTVTETGPLAAFTISGFDAPARRVLPGNLLRRCGLLASLATAPGSAHSVRAGVVSASGEEAVLTWSLVKGGPGEAWKVAAVSADGGVATAAAADPLAAAPHPRTGPEAVALVVARLLAGGQVGAASAYVLGPPGVPARAAALASAATALRGGGGSGVPAAPALGASACPTLRSCLVEVVDGRPGGSGSESGGGLVVFDMCLRDSGCWAVRGAEAW
jgi:hypothetical protein